MRLEFSYPFSLVVYLLWALLSITYHHLTNFLKTNCRFYIAYPFYIFILCIILLMYVFIEEIA